MCIGLCLHVFSSSGFMWVGCRAPRRKNQLQKIAVRLYPRRIMHLRYRVVVREYDTRFLYCHEGPSVDYFGALLHCRRWVGRQGALSTVTTAGPPPSPPPLSSSSDLIARAEISTGSPPPASLRVLMAYTRYIYTWKCMFSFFFIVTRTGQYSTLQHTRPTKKKLANTIYDEILNLTAGALFLSLTLRTPGTHVPRSRETRDIIFYQLRLLSQGSVNHLAGARAEHGHRQVFKHTGHSLAAHVLEVLSVGPHLFPHLWVYRAAVNLAPLDYKRPTCGLGKMGGRAGGGCNHVMHLWSRMSMDPRMPFETEHRPCS